jgi:hypothetical protein
MYSLLKEAGIPAYYTIIKAGENKQYFENDFPSNQFNHVIVCVPLDHDTTWLECTSQTLTPGYLGRFTSNRNALIIDEKNGKLVRTPKYSKEENLQSRNIKAKLDEEGNLTMNIVTDYNAEQQDDVHGFLHSVSKDIITEYLNQKLSIPSYDLVKYEYTSGNSVLPSITEKLEVVAHNYAAISGKRIFINPDILNHSSIHFTSKNKRTSPFNFIMEYTDRDTVQIFLPSGYVPESIPADESLSTPYGVYKSKHIYKDGQLIYTREMQRNSGSFPATDAASISAFYETIYKADRSKVILVKENQ